MIPFGVSPAVWMKRIDVRALLGTALLLLALWLTGTRDVINHAITDRHFRWRAFLQPGAFPSELVVIAVDDRTPVGPSRAKIAELIDHLSQARVIALDYILDTKQSEPDGDKALAEAIRRNGHVLLPFYLFSALRPVTSKTQDEQDQFLETFPQATRDPDSFAPLNGLLLQPPSAAIRQDAAGFGLANVNAERDNVFRQPILVRRVVPDGVLIPQFAVALAANATKTPLADALRDAPEALHIGARSIPLMQEGSLLLAPFVRRPGTRPPTLTEALLQGEPVGTAIPTISFADAMSVPSETFKDKVILLGETRTGTSDIRPIATDNGLRGVELTAQITASLLQGDDWQFVPPVLHLLLLLVALLPIYLYSRASLRFATGAALLTLLGLIMALEILFWAGHRIPDTTAILGAWIGSTLFSGQQRAAEEFHRRERLRDEFAAYVSPEVADDLVRQGGQQWEESRRERMAILFADIRNFTPYTEANPPELVQRQLTEFLGAMTEAVFTRRGFLDKFIGDAIMVLFDPFHPRANRSAEAILCALEMLASLDRLNARWQEEGLPTFRIGIGIHSGEVLFGNMSSRRRKTLTAIGDNVNLAARIESATKEYHVPLLVSAETKAEAEETLAGQVTFEDMGEFTARGRKEATRLFAVHPCASIPSPASR